MSFYSDRYLLYFQASDVIAKCLVKQNTWDEITGELKNNIVSLVPASKYLSAMAMLNTWDNCMKVHFRLSDIISRSISRRANYFLYSWIFIRLFQKSGSSMDAAFGAISKAFATVLKTPYTNVCLILTYSIFLNESKSVGIFADH